MLKKYLPINSFALKITFTVLILGVISYLFRYSFSFPLILIALLGSTLAYLIQEVKSGLTIGSVLVILSFLLWASFTAAVIMENPICSSIKLSALVSTFITWFYKSLKSQNKETEISKKLKLFYGISSVLIILSAVFKILHLKGAEIVFLIAILYIAILELLSLWAPKVLN